jgi:hyperosmotically inducible protein
MNRTRWTNVVLAAACAAGMAACSRPASEGDESQGARGYEPTNTGRNERDRGEEGKTPMDQGQDEADIKITQEIRQAVVEDDALSNNAKNVKIITEDKKVTLRGPVETATEKAVIEQKAEQVPGVTQVENQLEVAQVRR